MKKAMFFVMLATLLAFAGCEKLDGPNTPYYSSGHFSVSEDGRQVRFAHGNLEYDGSYHFAAHQYDYGGTGSNPTNTSTDWHDYPSFDDWGNHIAGSIVGGWRTLTDDEWIDDEWIYVIGGRVGARSKRGAATVCGVHGIVLLPDGWIGGTFNADFRPWGCSEGGALCRICNPTHINIRICNPH